MSGDTLDTPHLQRDCFNLPEKEDLITKRKTIRSEARNQIRNIPKKSSQFNPNSNSFLNETLNPNYFGRKVVMGEISARERILDNDRNIINSYSMSVEPKLSTRNRNDITRDPHLLRQSFDLESERSQDTEAQR